VGSLDNLDIGIRLVEYGDEFLIGIDILGSPCPEIDGCLLAKSRTQSEDHEQDHYRRSFKPHNRLLKLCE